MNPNHFDVVPNWLRRINDIRPDSISRLGFLEMIMLIADRLQTYRQYFYDFPW